MSGIVNEIISFISKNEKDYQNADLSSILK